MYARRFVLAALSLAALHAWSGAEIATDGRISRIDAALAKAAACIVATQSPDGAWRSATYGALREGPPLTPYIMSSLFFLPQGGDAARDAFRKGSEYLMALVSPDGSIEAGPYGLNYPVYVAASASRVVALENRSERNLWARDAWLQSIRDRQLVAVLGWNRSDPEYGGWGFSMDILRKPAPGEPMSPFLSSNLSSTVFAVGALRSARVPEDDPVWGETLVFVKKCQNYDDDAAKRDPDFDDGGFYFKPNSALENKAGIAGTDRHGRERYGSYGSMTADGVRALVACGLPPEHPRVAAARAWLERNFAVERHPGRFSPDREVLRDATYYYYLWSVSHFYSRLGIVEIETDTGSVAWAEVMAAELLQRQRDDGTWVNAYTDAKEDDPLVATPWAASALAVCRQVILAPGKLSRTDYPTLAEN